MSRIAVAVVALTATLLAGCGGSSAASATADLSAADAVFVAEDLAYSDAPAQLPAGEVTIGLQNNGSLPHDVAIEGVDGDAPVVEAGGGGSAVGTVTLEPGTYVYYCTVPGHRAAGMEGQLEVR